MRQQPITTAPQTRHEPPMRVGACRQCQAEILVSDDTPDVCADCWTLARYPDVPLTDAERDEEEARALRRWVR